ncbi:MAG: DNA-binding transcriptional LysR family regulator [Oleiphilaceae bacterium]|jgi:DNA-binding transcriptional LysR family regulator
MELADLTVFREVALSGGITYAAKKLHRVPSNVTTRIQKLEEELGQALFIREKNRLTISNAGKMLLIYADEILALVQSAKDQLQDSEPSGSLRIGSMEAVAATRLVKPLQYFHMQYPKVTLQVKASPTGVLLEDVVQGNVDLALVADPANDPRLYISPVFEERLVMVSSLGHKKILKPSDLGISPSILGFNHRCAYRNRLLDWFKAGDCIPNIIEMNSYHVLLSCAAAGMGVGMVPIELLKTYPFAESIRVHDLPEKWSRTTTALIWHNERVTPAMRAFEQYLLA